MASSSSRMKSSEKNRKMMSATQPLDHISNNSLDVLMHQNDSIVTVVASMYAIPDIYKGLSNEALFHPYIRIAIRNITKNPINKSWYQGWTSTTCATHSSSSFPACVCMCVFMTNINFYWQYNLFSYNFIITKISYLVYIQMILSADESA